MFTLDAMCISRAFSMKTSLRFDDVEQLFIENKEHDKLLGRQPAGLADRAKMTKRDVGYEGWAAVGKRLVRHGFRDNLHQTATLFLFHVNVLPWFKECFVHSMLLFTAASTHTQCSSYYVVLAQFTGQILLIKDLH